MKYLQISQLLINMKVALITVQNANNYGAIFQAYALQNIISEKSEIEIINYENKHISRSFDIIRFKPTVHGVLGTGKDVFRLFPRYRVLKKFKRFIADNLQLTVPLSKNDLENFNWDNYEIFVAGSDQIWNPACISDNNILDSAYFLNFVPKGRKKISYASSMGAYTFSGEEMNQVKHLLQDFAALSVREKERQKQLKEELDREVHHVLDPSLLLPKTEYLKLIDGKTFDAPKSKYILLYTVPKVPLIKKAVKYFSEKLGYKVISIEQGLSAGAKVNKQYRDAGPLEFINLFQGAEFVITDSFHGVCFSVNFEKPFVAVSPGKNVNRMRSLLGALGLEERIIEQEEDFKNLNVSVDYKQPQRNLNEMRNSSLDFLFQSLKS
ncbi:polysaccharide pyruvyl transferase family protein [Gramella sp. MT6]|uniref:polysaccharide pyruvyl transferase family protein n=1 Tax=Gramella sp. MT6 TaxID=2705471 RepID=UPI001C60288D|nr:polysaccharide pyruvyl transferase family protein [Gramella sp. MT6]QYA24392.1 polysaccharide pyruvyl transferase family protein [Gramella sp. MT6]